MADINIGQILEALNEKMDRNLSNTDAIGQAILDGKVEVEALLEQNGYAKFTWKNGNKISKLIVQWIYSTTGAQESQALPITHNSFATLILGGGDLAIGAWVAGQFSNLSSINYGVRGTQRYSTLPKYALTIGI